jgi:hypothetical protein
MSVTTTTRTRTSVGVHVWARSITWVGNELMRVLLEIATLRGLSVGALHEDLDCFVKAFRTWMTGRWLTGTTLEIYDQATDKLVERYSFPLSYETTTTDSTEERFHTHVDNLRTALKTERQLRPGCRYRVIVHLTADAPDLPGWSRTTTRDCSHLDHQDLSGNVIETARINVQMEYWTERSKLSCAE